MSIFDDEYEEYSARQEIMEAVQNLIDEGHFPWCDILIIDPLDPYHRECDCDVEDLSVLLDDYRLEVLSERL